MQTRRITKADYDRIVEVSDQWWGGPISTLAHPIFFHELGDRSLIVEDGNIFAGFLLGFVTTQSASANPPGAALGYVHLVGIHPDYRRRGVGRLLYATFDHECQQLGCTRLKAITAPANATSIAFHVALGFQVEAVDDYAGIGRKRLVLTKDLGETKDP